MTQRREFWWVAQTLRDGSEREPEVAQVWFKDDGTIDFSMLAGIEDMLTPDEVRLIERVLPAGRAAAAIAKLEDAGRQLREPGPGDDIQEAINLLQGENQA